MAGMILCFNVVNTCTKCYHYRAGGVELTSLGDRFKVENLLENRLKLIFDQVSGTDWYDIFWGWKMRILTSVLKSWVVFL